MATSRLSSFLAQVAVSPKTQEELLRDPHEAVRNVGLSAESRKAILAGRPKAIRNAILAEKGIEKGVNAAGDTEVVLVVVI